MTTYLPPRAQLSAGLLVASRQWQRLADQAFGEFGLSSACTGPLLMIGRSGGGIRQVALAQQLGMEGPSLVRLLDKLCAQALVRREADSSDRRANQLWLTEAGQALVGQIEARLVALRAEVFGALSDAEVEVVLKLWGLIAEANARLP
ncbi:MarR family transcriptional regulator [Xanthomonas campestris]|jgi:MarR family transcriptional regulator for hemolysin|uniref:Transcriptional regulator for cryptic hemolysin n=3 Tax=Xanthomonas campestris pv. campestris TaxID=340 RepID=Q8P3A9_XANCP|nr:MULTISPECIES: MarR family transcriptional regulator [Xanthomonas]AAM43383.1 transcriptional regulator for cryptic hemolysin [Xanthomonas campestris pv. campestris str. ATCC 33913]AAY51292.1 transcriptional regulator for cryptic hemolysin [Xanthomonas campestris pv. campestris str. 8004]AKS22075.1 MarR family transcriptional regulator [Xanthomonas campestris pv. campestris]ALE70635.1 MarR family transcriptional regulator [Xanthomonas campestris pv. campestris]KIQ28572.1 MarR family transcrip